MLQPFKTESPYRDSCQRYPTMTVTEVKCCRQTCYKRNVTTSVLTPTKELTSPEESSSTPTGQEKADPRQHHNTSFKKRKEFDRVEDVLSKHPLELYKITPEKSIRFSEEKRVDKITSEKVLVFL